MFHPSLADLHVENEACATYRNRPVMLAISAFVHGHRESVFSILPVFEELAQDFRKSRYLTYFGTRLEPDVDLNLEFHVTVDPGAQHQGVLVSRIHSSGSGFEYG